MSINALNHFKHKKIALLGLGLENLALLRLLLKHQINCAITICDARSIEKLGARYLEFKKYKNVFWQLENKFNKNLFLFDILFRSPGWPLSCSGLKAIKDKKTEITSSMNLFFDLAPTKNIIGVSGTKGKGTTASLIYHLLKTAGEKVYLGGNIGVAPLAFVEKIKPSDWVVLELSSFQLEDLKHSPKISVITNIYKEHLSPADPLNPNYHKNYPAYIKAKLNTGHYQKKSDYLLLNEKFKNVFSQYKNYWGQGKKLYFTKSELVSRLVGDFNKENIAAGVMAAKLVKIKPEIIARGVKTFAGLEHRLEFVLEKNKIKYYDNSFCTTPESTILDLRSFAAPIILMVGGADKGANFKNLAKTIKQKVKYTILLHGDATPRIKSELAKIGYPSKNMKLVYNMEEAMKIAREQATAGDIILLSTACASFGMFNNYKERGDLFKKYARK